MVRCTIMISLYHKTNIYVYSNEEQKSITYISTMSEKFIPSLLTLPVELVYRILDNLNEFTILYSMRHVCTRMNKILDSYYRYQVNFFVI
jgi:hypothetical protein